MVRMSDLVRGGAAPPLPSPARRAAREEAPESAPRPPAAPAAEPPALRMASPATAMASPQAPAAPVEPAGDEASGPPPEAIFADLVAVLQGVRDTLRSGGPLPWIVLAERLETALRSLERSGDLFWVANRPAVPPDADYVAFHQARVAVLALRVGANLGLDHDSLIELGMAGCLIDAALWQLSPALLRRLDALSAEEQALYRAHPRVAAELVRRLAPPSAAIPEMILQHHEREQGQGFPQGLAGDAIRVGSKILGLVDTYTGLTAPPSLRSGLRPHEAIREIVRSKHESFPPALIKALLSEISVFPPGTVVRLNSGEVGRVIGVNRRHPLRPRIEVSDARGEGATGKVIDLAETPFLYITGPVESVR